MNITAFIRKGTSAKSKTSEELTIHFRVRDRSVDLKVASELRINPSHWDPVRMCYKNRVSAVPMEVQKKFNSQVMDIINLIGEKYYRGAKGNWLQQLIQQYHHPQVYKYGIDGMDGRLTTQIRFYIMRHDIAQRTVYRLNSICRKVKRYEMYKQLYGKRKGFTLDVSTMVTKDLYDFQDFIRHEYTLVDTCPRLYDGLKSNQIPMSRMSDNAILDIMKYVRSVVYWCEEQGVVTKKPFSSFEMVRAVFGTPYFLTIEERDRIYNLNLLGEDIHLQHHRDMFMFQCMVGCRQGDLRRFTKDNIADGYLEYIPHKTLKTSASVVRVPLSPKAKEIVARYKDGTKLLFPYYETPDYNRSIRKLCTMAGITRKVSVIDLLTKSEVKKPINEIASSHMARRTFIGNLYKKVKDPNLIASMTGHTEGSRAFARYRAIDDEIKQELITMIS